MFVEAALQAATAEASEVLRRELGHAAKSSTLLADYLETKKAPVEITEALRDEKGRLTGTIKRMVR